MEALSSLTIVKYKNFILSKLYTGIDSKQILCSNKVHQVHWTWVVQTQPIKDGGRPPIYEHR